jgi:hypothetical protein
MSRMAPILLDRSIASQGPYPHDSRKSQLKIRHRIYEHWYLVWADKEENSLAGPGVNPLREGVLCLLARP